MIIRLVTLNLIHLYDDIMIPVESFSSLSEYHYYFHINSPVLLLLFSSVCCCCCYIRFMGKAPNIRWKKKNFLKPRKILPNRFCFERFFDLTWLDCRWFFPIIIIETFFFLFFWCFLVESYYHYWWWWCLIFDDDNIFWFFFWSSSSVSSSEKLIHCFNFSFQSRGQIMIFFQIFQFISKHLHHMYGWMYSLCVCVFMVRIENDYVEGGCCCTMMDCCWWW